MLQISNGYEGTALFRKSAITMNFNGEPVRLAKSNFSGEIGASNFEKEILVFQFNHKEIRHGKAVITIDPISVEMKKGSEGHAKLESKVVPPLKIEVSVN